MQAAHASGVVVSGIDAVAVEKVARRLHAHAKDVVDPADGRRRGVGGLGTLVRTALVSDVAWKL